jgi:hypothetical protein
MLWKRERLVVRLVQVLVVAVVCASALFGGVGATQSRTALAAGTWRWNPDYTILANDFTIVALPDTQNYSQFYPSIYITQTNWIAAKKNVLQIAYVAHLGDIVNVGSNSTQWNNASQAMTVLEQAGVPYGVTLGNHDHDIAQEGNICTGTTSFNANFGVSRLQNAFPANYGGHYGANNASNYMLFSAGGMDFIAINLEYDGSYQRDRYPNNPVPPADPHNNPVLQWADGLLQTYSSRRAIVVTHAVMNTTGGLEDQGQAIYDVLDHNPSFFMMLGGHWGGSATVPGENRIHLSGGVDAMLSDYQFMANGGDGWLRVMTFSPARNKIFVRTYSPARDWRGETTYERTQVTSRFDLTYDMGGRFEAEPNNDMATANGPLVLDGVPIYGINDGSASDWFYFNLTASQEVEILLDGDGPYTGWQLYRNGSQVAYGGEGRTTQYVAPSTGTYYVGVSGYPALDYALFVTPPLEGAGCGSCDPYQGDTSCSTSLPILCIKPANLRRLSYAVTGSGHAMPPEYYRGWTGGYIGLTSPVAGTSLTSLAAANTLCANTFGSGYRMAEHHDGRWISGMGLSQYFGLTWPAPSQTQAGGWDWYAYGSISGSTRFWVYINDQAGNCWNSTGGKGLTWFRDPDPPLQ